MKQSRTRLRVLASIAVVLLLTLVLYKIVEYSFQPPATSSPSPPSATLVDLPSSLTMAKSICEGQARIARKAARNKLISPVEEENAENLYFELRQAIERCIDAFEACLPSHFENENDVLVLEDCLTEAVARNTAFMAWNARAGLPKFFDSDPLTEACNGMKGWVRQYRNDEATRSRVGAGIAGARLATWQSLKE